MTRLLEILAPVSAALAIGLFALLPDAPSEPARDWPALPALEKLALDEVPAGETLHWRDDTLGYEAKLTAEQPYLDDEGRVCRSFERLIQAVGDGTIGTNPDNSSRHLACRQGDGSWRSAAAPARDGPGWTQTAWSRLFGPGETGTQLSEAAD
jgi:surface antigen